MGDSVPSTQAREGRVAAGRTTDTPYLMYHRGKTAARTTELTNSKAGASKTEATFIDKSGVFAGWTRVGDRVALLHQGRATGTAQQKFGITSDAAANEPLSG